MTVDLSGYLDPDEMVSEYDEPEVTGVTTCEYPVRFVRASNLLTCEWCGNTGLHPSEVAAVRPRDKAIMMCSECEPEPEGWE